MGGVWYDSSDVHKTAGCYVEQFWSVCTGSGVGVSEGVHVLCYGDVVPCNEAVLLAVACDRPAGLQLCRHRHNLFHLSFFPLLPVVLLVCSRVVFRMGRVLLRLVRCTGIRVGYMAGRRPNGSLLGVCLSIF